MEVQESYYLQFSKSHNNQSKDHETYIGEKFIKKSRQVVKKAI